MRVLILGGDGYLGWPTAMNLSSKGHQVMVTDNYLRRSLSLQEDCDPLYEVPNLHDRAKKWQERTGEKIKVRIGDLCQYDFMAQLFAEFEPEAVIHYAEQPSAPYSMVGRHQAILTIENNLSTTYNLIFAIKEYNLDCHIIKLGTMGEYGTPNIDIEEGWLDVEYKGRKHKFLYPRQASSLYHTTKIMDTDLLWFYVRTWGIKVTDLMQGPVYGVFTDETGDEKDLLPFFNYDEIFGTVLNRFVVQAAAGYPLTVYGKGGQVRGYLNIKDTLNCVRLSLENPPAGADLRIFNQLTETFSVNNLADKVVKVGKDLGLNVEVKNLPNPRIEADEHYYNPAHTGLTDLGLEPNYLTDDVLAKMMEFVLSHKHGIRKETIFRNVSWRQ